MNRQRLKSLLPLAIVAAFALVIVLFLPFRFKFEFDTDEGIQLIKAFLYARGHALQTEIYSDQPPLLTVVLAALFRVFGPQVLVARLAVLGFSCLLLASAALFLRDHHGRAPYLIALLFLVTLPGYPEFSVSAMIGLPALSLAMVSLYLLGRWRLSRKAVWLLLSAAVLALSTLTKAFTLILVPVFGLAILLDAGEHRPGGGISIRILWPAAAWAATLIGIELVLLLVILGPTGWDQLIGVHLAAQEAVFKGRRAEEALLVVWPILLLAVVGGWRSLVHRSWSGLTLTGWLALGLAALALNQPAWWHQHLLATVPAAMLAGVTAADALEALRGRFRPAMRLGRAAILPLLGVLIAAGYLAVRIPGHLEAYKARLPNLVDYGELNAREYVVLAAMEKADPDGGLIVTDRPMFAFRSGREIPPQLAVFSNKRLTTGWLTEDDVIAAIRENNPNVVLIARFSLPTVQSFVQGQYDLLYAHYPFRLYLRK